MWWNFVCHESEVRNPGDFRVVTVAGFPILLARDEQGVLRAFYNICRHRAAPVVRQECGNSKGLPVFLSPVDLWPRRLPAGGDPGPRGYEGTGFLKEDFPLLPVRVETAMGLVFVCLSDETEPLGEYLGEMVGPLEDPLGTEELEVFHYSQAILKTNWKLWNDNNSESYHNLLHVLNRRTGALNPDVLSRKWSYYPNGHNMQGQNGTFADYQAGNRDTRNDHRFPGIGVDQGMNANFFPDLLILFRTDSLRLDRVVPLEPGRTLVEWRGLGLKSDTEEVRELRIRHHNQYWGPAGRNLPEDIMATETQWENMNSGAVRYSIFARQEDFQAHDDENMRRYYQEWGKRMERTAAHPFGG